MSNLDIYRQTLTELVNIVFCLVRNTPVQHSFYLLLQFLEMLDTTIIPRDYPAVSSEAVDRTTLGPFSFMELQATLKVVSPPGWIVDPDREMV